MNTQRLILTIFALLFGAALYFWFSENFELREVKEYTGYRGEARSNNLFAARHFLQRMGIPTESKNQLQTLPSTDTAIVLNTQHYNLSQQAMQDLLAWVESGGLLIMRLRDGNEENEHDLLQQTLGVSVGKWVVTDHEQVPFEVQLSTMQQALEVDPDFFHHLETDAPGVYSHTYLDEDHDGGHQEMTWLLEQSWGDGKVFISSGLDFIENSSLTYYDHAELLWHMLHSLDTPQAVWLLHEEDVPPLWQLIWRHAWAFVLSLAAFIPLLILAYSPRFGPVIPQPAAHRRRILEHIQASGRFMWQRHHKYADKHYADFTASVEQLTEQQHDNPKYDT